MRIRPDLSGFNSTLGAGVTGSMSKVAKAASGILAGVGVAAAIKSTAQIGMAYQDTLNNLQAVSGATAKQMAAVSATAKQLGADTTLTATSAADAAVAMTELSKGGLSVDSAMKAAKGTLQLAAAAGIDAAQAATVQSAALNAYSLDASKAGHVSDVLANAANAAAGEITDFAQGLQQSGAVAHALGISLEDTSAVLGILANNGIRGADAGTLLKSALLALESPSKQAKKAMDDLGLKAFDAKGNFVGLDSIFGQLQKSSKKMTSEQYAAATSTLFGSDAARLAGVAAKEGSGGFEKMAAAMSKSGSAADVAAAKSKGVGGAIEAFKSQIETIQINVFEAIAPAVEGVVRRVSGAFDTLGKKIPDVLTGIKDFITGGDFTGTWVKLGVPVSVVHDFENFRDQAVAIFGNLKRVVQEVAPVIGAALGAAAGLAYEAFKLLLPVVQDVTGFFADNEWAIVAFAGALTALTLVTKAHQAAMTLSAAGGMAAWIKQTRIITSITKVWTALQWAFNAAMAVNPLVLVGIALAALVAGLILAYQHSQTFRDIVQGALHAVADAASWMWNSVLKPVWAALQSAWTATASGIQWAWNNIIKPVFDALATAAKVLFEVLLVAVFTPIMVAWKVLSFAFQLYWNNILKPVLQAVASVAQWLWTSVLMPTFNGIKQGWSLLVQGISWAWNNLLKPAWSAVAAAAQWLWNSVLMPAFNGIKAGWGLLVQGISWYWNNILKPVWTAVSTAANWLWNSVLKPVFGAIQTAWQALGTGLGWVFDHVIKPVFSAFGTVIGGIKTAFSEAVGFIGKVWGTVLDIVKKPVRFVLDFINNSVIGNLNKVTSHFGLTIPTIQYKFATGGIVPGGYSPGRDNTLAAVGSGEAIMRPEWTKAVGPGYVNAANAAARTGGIHGVREFIRSGGPAFRSGGIVGDIGGPLDFLGDAARSVGHAAEWTAGKVGDGLSWTGDQIKSLLAKGAGFALKHLVQPAVGFIADHVPNEMIRTLFKGGISDLVAKVEAWGNSKDSESASGGTPGGSGGGLDNGWRSIFNIVKAAIPQARVNSAYRPGDPGYHGKGKAVDMGFGSGPGGNGSAGLASINQFLYDRYGGKLAELIYDGVGDSRPDIKNGRNHTYDAATRGQHHNHVHAAVYDRGGVLPPGLTIANNKSRKPEGILTNDQLGWLQTAASGGGAAPLIGGDLVLQVAPGADVRDQMESAMFELRRIKRGGAAR